MAGRRRKSSNRDVERLASQAVGAFGKLSPRNQLIVGVLLVAVVAVVLFVESRRRKPETAPTQPPIVTSTGPTTHDNLTLGLPSPATNSPSNRNDYLLVKPTFALSYNDSAGEANWVSWVVSRNDLGNAPRKQEFDADASLPAGFQAITHRDYSGSGFDRGHLCPNADRDVNKESNWSTFVMTNVIPQAPNLNQKAWADLELAVRDLVRDGNRAYQIAGPSGRGGVGENGRAETIAGGRVVVPAFCWKIVVVVPERGQPDGALQFTGDERVIAVWMPNDNAIPRDWKRFRTSPAEIERKTGLRFFAALPAAVAERLRQKVDRE